MRWDLFYLSVHLVGVSACFAKVVLLICQRTTLAV